MSRLSACSFFSWSEDWRAGGEAGCALLFLVPFVLVGIGLIGGIIYQLLALANPRPHLLLDRSRLEPGTQCSVRFYFTGSTSRLREITVELEGRESATYRRGTNSVTDHETFFEEVLLNEKQPSGQRRTLSLSIPERTMPSFEADNNRIEWRIKVHGDIPRWPDVKEELLLTVHPPAEGSL